jgi:hypothetical protein
MWIGICCGACRVSDARGGRAREFLQFRLRVGFQEIHAKLAKFAKFALVGRRFAVLKIAKGNLLQDFCAILIREVVDPRLLARKLYQSRTRHSF